MPRNAVEKLIKKHRTGDPFRIAAERNIMILYEDLGHTVRGYYLVSRRQKTIHINSRLSKEEQRVVCAHELGHDVLHPGVNTPFLKNHTYQCTQKNEIEANTFAAHLLIPDDALIESKENGYTLSQLAALCEVPEELAALRIRK